MIKHYLLLLALTLGIATANAQSTIANAGMESWQNVGQATEEPVNWNSIKTGSGNSTAISFAPKSCFRESNNPRSGTYCARLETGSALGQIAPGSMATGRFFVPNLSASEGYIRTVPGDANFSMPFTARPDSFVFWFRYTRAGNDFPSMSALLHVGNAYLPEQPVNNNHPDSSVNIIARALWSGPTSSVSTWTRVSLPFQYVDNRTPQYILITFTPTGNASPSTAGSTIWLDDIDVIYNPTIATGTINPLTYYVSATQGSSISVPFTMQGVFQPGNTVTAQLSDASGSFANPITIGSVSATASGTINATIPAGTAAGTGYRVRVLASSPALTAAANTSNITVVNVSSTIAPATAQTIAANTNGTALSVSATAGATANEWKFATTPGGPYSSFSTAQTGTAYTPNFATAGTYYVVCESTYPGGATAISNEATINVVQSVINPATPQSILVGSNGSTLTVTETPAATAREWKFALASGGPYTAFNPAQTGTTYTPNFANDGVYYVVCESNISGVTARSNEVVISVNNVTLSVSGLSNSFPLNFSASAPNANITVFYNVGGSNFNNGNVFTAQLSDATGSFANPTNIGTVSAVSTGSIAATIPGNTTSGTAYRIRVVGSNPSVLGLDNGSDLTIDQFSVRIAPTAAQTLQMNQDGTTLTVTESQNILSRNWVVTTTSGSGYTPITPAASGTTYTPNFSTPGTYYVACASVNSFGDEVISNEVEVTVLNGTVLTTGTVTGSPYLVSASANVTISVPFTSDAVFAANNVFSVELSDNNGSFASPVVIGTATGSAIAPVTAQIPNASINGTGYRVRVVSTNPAITGTDNGTDLTIIPFELVIDPLTTQNIAPGQPGSPITVTESHPATRQWLWSDLPNTNFQPFNPAQTGSSYTPQFPLEGTYYVACRSTNGIQDVITSQSVMIVVDNANNIDGISNSYAQVYWNGNTLVADLQASAWTQATMQVFNMNGQQLLQQTLQPASINNIATNLPAGTYLFRLTDGNKQFNGKLIKAN